MRISIGFYDLGIRFENTNKIDWSWIEIWEYQKGLVILEWDLRISRQILKGFGQLRVILDKIMNELGCFCHWYWDESIKSLMCNLNMIRMQKVKLSLLLEMFVKCSIDTFHLNDKIFEFNMSCDSKEFLSKWTFNIWVKIWRRRKNVLLVFAISGWAIDYL